jgi:hypothetical protein
MKFIALLAALFLSLPAFAQAHFDRVWAHPAGLGVLKISREACSDPSIVRMVGTSSPDLVKELKAAEVEMASGDRYKACYVTAVVERVGPADVVKVEMVFAIDIDGDLYEMPLSEFKGVDGGA